MTQKLNDYQLLIKARNLIRKPNGWTKGASKRIRPDGTVAYCASGACMEVTKNSDKANYLMRKYLERAAKIDTYSDGYVSTIGYNDNYVGSQKRAIAWFQRAIRLAAKELKLGVRV